MESTRDDDPELSELRQVIGAWHTYLQNDTTSVRAVVELAFEQFADDHGDLHPKRPDLRDVLVTIAGERGSINSRRFGKWLLKQEGRIVSVKSEGERPRERAALQTARRSRRSRNLESRLGV